MRRAHKHGINNAAIYHLNPQYGVCTMVVCLFRWNQDLVWYLIVRRQFIFEGCTQRFRLHAIPELSRTVDQSDQSVHSLRRCFFGCVNKTQLGASLSRTSLVLSIKGSGRVWKGWRKNKRYGQPLKVQIRKWKRPDGINPVNRADENAFVQSY